MLLSSLFEGNSCNSGIHIYLSDLNKNIGGLMDLAKKRPGSTDLHTPVVLRRWGV